MDLLLENTLYLDSVLTSLTTDYSKVNLLQNRFLFKYDYDKYLSQGHPELSPERIKIIEIHLRFHRAGERIKMFKLIKELGIKGSDNVIPDELKITDHLKNIGDLKMKYMMERYGYGN